MRKITVNGMTFKWKVGKSNVLVKDPNGVSYYTEIYKLSETFIRDCDDHFEEEIKVVLPGRVANYIKAIVIPLMKK